jgi:pimeloyl-ACP methyl ester carboxylesterase
MADRFAAEIPGAERVVFEDAGHFVWEDRPHEAAGALVDFLQRHS